MNTPSPLEYVKFTPATPPDPKTAALIKEIEIRFTYHAPKDDQPSRYITLRNAAKDLATLIAYTVPESREQALAITHLETAIFYANAAIARRE